MLPHAVETVKWCRIIAPLDLISAREADMAEPGQTRILAGTLWMLVISVLLFWLPVAGPLIAGVVGGKKAGGVGAAIVATFLPAILVGIFLFAFATALTGIPLLGVVAGAGGFTLVAMHVGLLLVGAIIGGVLA
jgi:hypothetical protein